MKFVEGKLARPPTPPGVTSSWLPPWRRGAVFALAVVALAFMLPLRSAGADPVPTEIPKDAIPSYFVVLHFFESTVRYADEMPYAYEIRLEALGLERGSAAEKVLAAAARAAAAVLSEPSIDPALRESEEEFAAFQEAALREKARALAEVYGGLLADLEAAGLDPDRVREYLELEIRPNVSLWVEVTPGQDPVTELLADRNVQAALGFDEMARRYYRDGVSETSKGE